MVLATLILFGQPQVVLAAEPSTSARLSVTHIGADGTKQVDPADLTPVLASTVSGDAKVHVQTTAHMTSQIAGGYRWQVDVEVRIESTVKGQEVGFIFRVPVVLQYERFGSVDAVEAASTRIGRKFAQEWLQHKG